MLPNANASSAPHAATVEKVTELVGSIAGKNGQTRQIGPLDSLTDAGVSSLDMVNLMLALESAFDLFIPAEHIKPSSFRSITAIATMIDGLKPMPLAAVA